MKKYLISIIFLIFLGCTHYKSNNRINNRTEPIIIIAMDTTTRSVVLRDGDNKIFTIYDNPTTEAITSSLNVGDTLRLNSINSIIKKF